MCSLPNCITENSLMVMTHELSIASPQLSMSLERKANCNNNKKRSHRIHSFAKLVVPKNMSSDFGEWLNKKLCELNTDESVFGSYISGILEGDETVEEKREALEGILAAIIEDNIEQLISDIIDRWDQSRPKDVVETKVIDDVNTKLAKLLENQQIATTVQRQYTPEELRIREQILSQYSTVEFDDEYDDGDDGVAIASAAPGPATTSTNDPLLVKNTNAHDVQQLAKERREQAKLDSKAKKDKDKEDREKQKQLREEKKEKRKTVKGERRR